MSLFQLPWQLIEIITDFLDLESYRNLWKSSSECQLNSKGSLSTLGQMKAKRLLEQLMEGAKVSLKYDINDMDILERFWIGYGLLDRQQFNTMVTLSMHFKRKRLTTYLLKSTGKQISRRIYLHLLQYGDPELVEWGIMNCKQWTPSLVEATRSGNLECVDLVISHGWVIENEVWNSLEFNKKDLNDSILEYAKSFKYECFTADSLITFTVSKRLSDALSRVLDDYEFAIHDPYLEDALAVSISNHDQHCLRLLLDSARIEFKKFPINFPLIHHWSIGQDLIFMLIEDKQLTQLFPINELFVYVAVHGMIDVLEYLLNIPTSSRLYTRITEEFDLSFDNNAILVHASKYQQGDCVELILNDPRFEFSKIPEGFSLFDCVNDPNHLKVLLSDARLDPTQNDNGCFIRLVHSLNIQCVKLLMKDSRIDPCCRNHMAIKWTSCKEYGDQILDVILQDQRVDPSINNNEPLFLACSNGRYKSVRLLVNHPKFNPKDNISKLLTWTIRRKQSSCLSELLEVCSIACQITANHVQEAIAKGLDDHLIQKMTKWQL
ncbi:hypothetical protein BC833DRAFT_613161 [Globomyces pollinis-pini]|nr:hypothetical protein BC833DRAFT_613161 [Globomyces pollinis-pini]